ncbi:MAG: hypothetical protein E7Z93_01985 [Cyanobacteria bacterium SIG32]|nr:hypothetical protein [Cyanobacteria bacterium SIG32]
MLLYQYFLLYYLYVREDNMKKKIIIGLSILLVVVLASVGAYAYGTMNQKHKPSDYNIGIKYEDAVVSDKPMLALFYVDWCGYCLKFMPKYKTISSIYKKDYNVVMLNAENPRYKTLVEDVTLGGYPTLYIIDPKYDNRVHISNSIYADLKKMRVELDRYLRVRKLLDSVPEK